MAHIISVCNQKGGVGKTTTTVNLAHGLHGFGYKVLTVDFDPQRNLTYAFGVNEPDELDITVYDIINAAMAKDTLPDLGKCVLTFEGVDILPANSALSRLDLELVGVIGREYGLKKALALFAGQYDYILIDCGPTLGILTLNALTASNSVLITTNSEFFSAMGLELMLDTIGSVVEYTNRELTIDGILLTMFDRRLNASRSIEDIIRTNYGSDVTVYETVIPRGNAVNDAYLKNENLLNRQKSKVGDAYKAFADEYLRKGRK